MKGLLAMSALMVWECWAATPGGAQWFEVDTPALRDTRVEWQLTTVDLQTVNTIQVELAAAREGYAGETGCLAPGDYYLTLTLHDAGQAYRFSQILISRVQDWEQRRQSLKDRVPNIAGAASPTGLATLRQLLSLLESLLDCPQLLDILADQFGTM